MTPPASQTMLDEHNRRQREYFDPAKKRNMLPRKSFYLDRQVDELMRFIDLSPAAELIEIGCGMGRYTLPLAERGFSVEGLDISPVLLERLREFDGGRHDLRLHEADVADPPAELHGRFDAVVGFFVIHHFHDLDRCFAGIRRLLRPGGTVVFLEPNALNPLYYIQILARPSMTWEGDGGIIRMRPGPVHGAMEQAGLSRCRLHRFGFFPPFLVENRYGRVVESKLERIRPFAPFLPFQLFSAQAVR